MQILMIDAPPLFRDFLKNKLSAEKIVIEQAQIKRDAATKILSMLPDLVIIDSDKYLTGIVEIMEKKTSNPNTASIPTIITGPVTNSDTLTDLMHLGMTYYFTKPLQYDKFYEAIAKICRTQCIIDKTPCILETHINGNLIFAELTEGLNRDKLSLLKYRLADLISINKISSPKLVLLITGMSLTFVDGFNLELLFNSLVSTPGLSATDITVLTLDPFTKELINGHKEYKGIKVVTNIIASLNYLVDSTVSREISDLIIDKILSAKEEKEPPIIELRFREEADERRKIIEELTESEYEN